MDRQTLTEIEISSLNQEFNFADGHAYHDLDEFQQKVVASSVETWHVAKHMSKQEVESYYVKQFIRLTGAHSLDNYPNLVFCPTASNSIDMVGAWLSSTFSSVALLEPTFDNLALLLKRRRVPLVAINENELHNGDIEKQLTQKSIDAIFLVNPNNPTGRTLSLQQWTEIIDVCKKHKITLIIDATFRFFIPCDFCLYQLLFDSGISFICIEDTGKVFPTLEMKCSMVVFSNNISHELHEIYEEFYLRHSSFILLLLAEFMKDAANRTLSDTLIAQVKKRRSEFRRSIKGSVLEIDNTALNSMLSVEWCRIKDSRYTEHVLMSFLKKRNIGVLPGSHFFWSKEKQKNHYLRFALLKPANQFFQGLQSLQIALEDMTCIY